MNLDLDLADEIESLLERDEREDRFAAWLRDRLARMRSLLRELQQLRAENNRISEMLDGELGIGDVEPDTWFEDDTTEKAIPIGAGTKVTFGPGQQFEVRWDAEGNCLVIEGSRALAFHPGDAKYSASVTLRDIINKTGVPWRS